MPRLRLIFPAALFLLLVTASTVFGGGLAPGSSGQAVRRLQQDLAFLGYLSCLPTGYYGAQTTAAVKAFQKANGLKPDGHAGPQTLSALTQRVRSKNANLTSRRNDAVGILPWDEVNRLFPRGTTARVWDVESGKGFQVWRLQGTYHADVEPLTRTDTAILLAACGGHWTAKRRPALVEIEGRLVAASMYPYPHGNEAIHNNGFNGQFCLHFLGSRVHKSGRVDPAHQEAILRAAQAYPVWQAPAADAPIATTEASPETTAAPRIPLGILESQ
ncbi:MAG: peptidoglycan-binding domain-containing protein [Bacteroidota bacterium]